MIRKLDAATGFVRATALTLAIGALLALACCS